ncbi:hypothetical protein GJ496_003851 [Pomphorhynchus laevis]|nr:hypothetical protein GJ496_003851 [Pomphorhynchus laevis]
MYYSDGLLKYADYILNCKNQEQVDREEKRKFLRKAQQEPTIHNIKAVQCCNEKLNESSKEWYVLRITLNVLPVSFRSGRSARLSTFINWNEFSIECIGGYKETSNYRPRFRSTK